MHFEFHLFLAEVEKGLEVIRVLLEGQEELGVEGVLVDEVLLETDEFQERLPEGDVLFREHTLVHTLHLLFGLFQIVTQLQLAENASA